MIIRLKLAFRNIFRHGGRTSVSLLMIAGAVVGLVLFIGFSDHILHGMQRIVIDNEYGHIQVAQKDFWNLVPGNRKGQLIPNAEEFAKKLSADPEVETVSGRLSFFGLISTGDITTSAKGLGFDPGREKVLARDLPILEGKILDPDSKLEVILGNGLQKKINVPVGGTVTVLSYTLDGVVNAMDLTVKGIFSTANAEIDNNVFMMPLSTVQMLLDTDRVEVLSVRIHETPRTDAVRTRIQAISQQVDPGYQAKTWRELSTFYRQVESFYKTQNRVIQIILLSLVFLGIMNTIGMSVFERTGEIGTVRALGETNRSVIWQFTLEGFILGTLGATLGALAGYVIGTIINSFQIKMDLPGTSVGIPIVINHVLSSYLGAMTIVILAATAATWIPSIRASRMHIVEALKKNI